MTAKEKLLGAAGSASGGLSILGGYNVCHQVCMSIATLLSAIGITVAGMPLMFLQKVAVPFWIIAVAMLISMLVLMQYRKMCFSQKMLLANAGLIIAGTPFQVLQPFQRVLWIIGGILVAGSIIWAIVAKKEVHRRAKKRS